MFGGSRILMVMAAVFAVSSTAMLFLHPDRDWPADEKVVTLFTPESPNDHKLWSEAIRRFEAKYSAEGYRVRWITAPYSHYGRKIQFMEVAHLQADVIYMDQKDFPLLYPLGVLEDLHPYLAEEEGVKRDDFVSVAVNQTVFEGRLYALPILYSPELVFYNKTEFRRLGIPLPKASAEGSWTYRDFLDAARKLTRDLDGDGRPDVHGLDDMRWEWIGFVWREGGEVFSRDLRECRLDSPEAIRGLQIYTDLHRTHRVTQRGGLSKQQSFSVGQIGMIFGARFQYPVLKKIKDFEWDVAPVPRSDTTGLGTSRIIVDSLALASHGRNKKLGWTFLRFLVSPEMMEFYAQFGSGLPGLKEVAERTNDPQVPNDHLFHNVPADSRYQYQPYKAAKAVHLALVDKLPLVWQTGTLSVEEGAREAAQIIRKGFAREEARERRIGRASPDIP